jgi:hypothetical protein
VKDRLHRGISHEEEKTPNAERRTSNRIQMVFGAAERSSGFEYQGKKTENTISNRWSNCVQIIELTEALHPGG